MAVSHFEGKICVKLDHLATPSLHAAHFDLVHSAVEQPNHLGHWSLSYHGFELFSRQVELGVCRPGKLVMSVVCEIHQCAPSFWWQQLDVRRNGYKRGRVCCANSDTNGVSVGGCGVKVLIAAKEVDSGCVVVVGEDANIFFTPSESAPVIATLHKRVSTVDLVFHHTGLM